MRSLNKQQAEEQRIDTAVLDHLTGKGPMRRVVIADELDEFEIDVCRSLIRLMNKGAVTKQYLKIRPADYYYERVHGADSPKRGSAA